MNAGRPSEPYVRYHYGGARTIYISAGAAGALNGAVDFYTNGDTYALVPAPDGKYTVISKPSATAKMINSQDLANYLNAKYPGQENAVLPAWNDRQVLLFGSDGAARSFDDTFQLLDLDCVSIHRCPQVSGDRFYVTKREPLCCTPYTAGSFLFLRKEDHGLLRRYDEPQKSCYRSKAVVRFCRKRWRSAKVFKRTFSDGILFSSDFAALAEAKGLPPGLKELPLGLEGPTLELCRDYSVRLSQDAYDLIGPRASAYISRQYIALRPDRRGELRFHYHLGGADTFSLQLSRLIPTFYPMAEQLHLEAHRDLFVLTAENAGGPYPPRDYFFRVSLEDQANDYS